jgi:hypothetical protein
MYIYAFLLRMTDTMTSQNIDLSSWDIPYVYFLRDVLRRYQKPDYMASKCRMTDELRRIWKESFVVLSRSYPGIHLEALGKTTKISVMAADVRF